jgi:hypothetical protein
MGKNGMTGGGEGSIDLAAYRLSRNTNEMIHSEIRALYSYWEALRGERPCPYRAEIEPRDMQGDARHLFLIEDLGDGNIRFRLAGSALADAIGFDLRGMSTRTIMQGKARESFMALISETLAEPGVGYARLLGPDGVQVWEIVLLPLRSDFGRIDRLIGCLHPVSGRAPVAGDIPARFTIDSMWIRTVEKPRDTIPGDAMPLAGFGESQTPFLDALGAGFTAIEGGLGEGERPDRARPALRVVKDAD